MARKFWSVTTFTATVDGTEYVFTCAGQDTSYGFRHVCFEGHGTYGDKIAKCTYYNRTWESFRFETVLRKAIEKQPKQHQEKLKAILIDKTSQDEHEKCEKEVAQFKALYDKTSDNFKENIAPKMFLQSESDMTLAKGLMALDVILNS